MTRRARRGPGRPAGGKLIADRERILDAAERVIARDGSAASLDSIAMEADVTKPIVYARVGSRADLSDALAVRLTERMYRAAVGAGGSNDHIDRDILAGILRSALDTIAAHRELFFYVTRGTTDDAAERSLYLARQSAEGLAVLLARLHRGHEADPTIAPTWAYGIVGMLNMTALWWLHEDSLPAEAIANHLSDLLWPGIQTNYWP